MTDAANEREIRALLESLEAWRAESAAQGADPAHKDTGEVASRIREIERRLTELGYKFAPPGKPAATDEDGGP
jgi:hypothetical protein